MLDQCIYVKGASTAITGFKRLVVVVIECCFVIIGVKFSTLGLRYSFVELLGRLWARPSQVFGFLLLLDSPLLFARLQVDFQTSGSELSPAYIAHEGFRTQSSRRFLYQIRTCRAK